MELKNFIFARCYFLKDEIERSYPNIDKTTFHISDLFSSNNLNTLFIQKGSEEAHVDLGDQEQRQRLYNSFYEKMSNF